MSYYEALKYLAKKYNIEIKERELTNEEKQAQTTRESMFIVNNFARDYFQNILKNHVDGRSIGLAYFRQRGFRDDIIEKFQLGYCTESHDAMSQEALRKGYKKEFLVKTGICYETDDHRLRDRFWGTCDFPRPYPFRKGGRLRRTCAQHRHQRGKGEICQLSRVGNLPQE